MLGNPTEHFWRNERINDEKFWSESIDEIIKSGSTSNSLFGTKLILGSQIFEQIAFQISLNREAAIANPLQIIEGKFSEVKYVFLSRRNKIAQAISWSKALQTNKWYRTTHELSASELDQKPIYNFNQIDGLIQNIIFRERIFQTYFDRNEIEVYSLFYEDLNLNPSNQLLNLAQWLGIKLKPHFEQKSMFTVQSDEESLKWEKMYIEDKYGSAFNHDWLK